MGKIGEEVVPYIPPVSYTAGLKVVRYTICSMKTRYIMSSQMHGENIGKRLYVHDLQVV